MSIKEKLAKIFRNLSKSKKIDDADTAKFMKEYDERVLKGATSGESYSEKTFEKIWELVDFSDKEILGIRWDELDGEKIKNQLISLGLKLRPSKSQTIIGFDLELIPGDTVEGDIAILRNRSHFKDGIDCSFGFIDRKADKLVQWVEKKYGKSLKLRDDTATEFYYDWFDGDVLIQVEIAKLSGLGGLTFDSKPDYSKVISGEMASEDFLKKYQDR